ncbi:MAG: hypothetical protein K2F69_01695 [Bacteroidaceae bacterium]|nr:hypothetical protein [Bacteroidaceae bacterium]
MRASRQQVIVSLTSFPSALPYAAQAFRSVPRDSLLSDKIVLYLDTPLFPRRHLAGRNRGTQDRIPFFEVRFNPAEIRSYKKQVPALRDFPDEVIVTIDDDIDCQTFNRILEHYPHIKDKLAWK